MPDIAALSSVLPTLVLALPFAALLVQLALLVRGRPRQDGREDGPSVSTEAPPDIQPVLCRRREQSSLCSKHRPASLSPRM